MGGMKKILTDDPLYAWHEYSVDPDGLQMFVSTEELYNFGTADEWLSEVGVEPIMASRFVKNLHILMRNGKDGNKYKPLLIHMKTCGGDWNEGMAMYDAIKTCPNPIVILNYTHARSMSSIIFQAAAKRVMMPHSYFMFHEGDAMVGGTNKQVREYVKFSEQDQEVMLDIYATAMKKQGKFSKETKTKIKLMLQELMNQKEDVYLTAKETVSWGLADEIFDGNWDKVRKIVK